MSEQITVWEALGEDDPYMGRSAKPLDLVSADRIAQHVKGYTITETQVIEGGLELKMEAPELPTCVLWMPLALPELIFEH